MSRFRATVGDVCAALNKLAPFELAAEWDNVGLIAGRREWPATKILLAIDLTDAVAREALKKDVDVLVVYHPPIFKGVRCVTPESVGPTSLLADLLAAKVSIVALHTAMDSAVGGMNDILLDVFEPVERYPLEPAVGEGGWYKLVVFVQPGEVESLREALADAGAGVIGRYSECSFGARGVGTFRGDETTRPTVGRKLVLERTDEVRLEMAVVKSRLGAVVRALCAAHSYEEPAFDILGVHEPKGRGEVGDGRVGVLARPLSGTALVRKLASVVDLSGAQVVGDLKRRFKSVTTAAGAFGARRFRDPESLVVTGEFKHHDALDLLRRGMTAVHVGHYASERPVLAVVRKYLARSVPGARPVVARSGRGPLVPIRL